LQVERDEALAAETFATDKLNETLFNFTRAVDELATKADAASLCASTVV
jgi:hypothetical protein